MDADMMTNQGPTPTGKETNGLQSGLNSHLKLKKDIVHSAEKVLRGGELTRSSNPVKNHIHDEAKKLAEKSRSLKFEECSMEALKQDGYNLTNFEESRIAMFPVESSGSSEDEIEPIYQSTEEIISIISGEPEIHEMYVLAKIDKKDQEKVELRIKIVKGFKDAEEPKIALARRVDIYYLYKVTVSSAVRKFEI